MKVSKITLFGLSLAGLAFTGFPSFRRGIRTWKKSGF